MGSTQFSAILSSYGQAIGIEGLRLDGQDCCMLDLNGALTTLMWRKEADSLIVYAPIGIVAEETDKTLLYRDLLQATTPGGETKDMAIGLMPEMNLLTLSVTLPGAALSAPMLCRFLDFFADSALYWQESVARLQEEYALRQPVDKAGAQGGLQV
ncbi:type III secretion system chaperone [Desulfovibrio sp. OttesenSCG-928-G11]|nr:type III secretion system chaperone [Desulfovibrio sp. OttesenSCG-928-G11]